MRSARGQLVAKLIIAAVGVLSVLELGGPWWYVALCLFAMGVIVVDAVTTYRRERRDPRRQ